MTFITKRCGPSSKAHRELLVNKQGNGVYFSVHLTVKKLFNQLRIHITNKTKCLSFKDACHAGCKAYIV